MKYNYDLRETLTKIVKANIDLFPLCNAPQKLLKEIRSLYKSEVSDDAITNRLNNIFKKIKKEVDDDK